MKRRRFRFVRQPEGEPQCGQACVAMICGVSVSKIVKIIGHGHGTTTKELRDALRSFGFKVADRLIPLRTRSRERALPARAILKLVNPTWLVNSTKRDGAWHWIVIWNGRFYDPDRPIGEYQGGRIASYLTIED